MPRGGSDRRPPTEAELRRAVAKQMRFVEVSAGLALGGDWDEAVRIAVSLRVLLHDTWQRGGSSYSILGQLGWKEKLHYVNTLRPLNFPGMRVAILARSATGEEIVLPEEVGLVAVTVDETGTPRFVPPLDAPAPPAFIGTSSPATLPFDRWWNEKAIFAEGEQRFSRWDLVDAMAHADGGAHLDPRGLTKDYAEFKMRGTGLEIAFSTGDAPSLEGEIEGLSPLGDAASPSVVQIAWELLKTLTDAGLPDGPAPE